MVLISDLEQDLLMQNGFPLALFVSTLHAFVHLHSLLLSYGCAQHFDINANCATVSSGNGGLM